MTHWLVFVVIQIPSFFSFMTYLQVCNKNNTTGVTSGVRNAYPSEASEFTLTFCGVHDAQSLVFYVVLC
jgi:hypothetical protein